MREFKIIVIGCGNVGKSALIVQYVSGIFVEKYNPTLEDCYRRETTCEQKNIAIEILDTGGTEQLFTPVLDQHFQQAHGFMIVYSINAKHSFRNVPEIYDSIVRARESCEDPNFICTLVGNKIDLESERQVPIQEGQDLARKIIKCPFYETTAKSRDCVAEVFSYLIRNMCDKYAPNPTKGKPLNTPTRSLASDDKVCVLM